MMFQFECRVLEVFRMCGITLFVAHAYDHELATVEIDTKPVVAIH